jgi:hypothetical protein
LKAVQVGILICDFKASRDSAALRSIKSLKKINHLPVEEFWKRVDAGGEPQWDNPNKKQDK